MAPSTEEQITALALTQHGGVLAPYVNDPEIRALLGRYVRKEIDDATLQGLIMQTKLWTTTSAAQRQWQTLETSDPATAQSKLQAQAAAIMATARQQGVYLDQARVDALAKASLQYGWNQAQLDLALGAEYDYTKGQITGRAAEFRSQVEGLLQSYGVRFSDQQKGQYVTWMMQGLDVGWAENQIREYAKGLYPTLTQWFDQGRTLEQFADPYRQMAVQTLGVNPAMVDWADPKWNAALSTIDLTTNQRRPLTLDEWQRKMRSDTQYGYWGTQKGKAEGASMVLNIAQSMGRIA